MTFAEYWKKAKLPDEMGTLSMAQLTVLRGMMLKAYNVGKKEGKNANNK